MLILNMDNLECHLKVFEWVSERNENINRELKRELDIKRGKEVGSKYTFCSNCNERIIFYL